MLVYSYLVFHCASKSVKTLLNVFFIKLITFRGIEVTYVIVAIFEKYKNIPYLSSCYFKTNLNVCYIFISHPT